MVIRNYHWLNSASRVLTSTCSAPLVQTGQRKQFSLFDFDSVLEESESHTVNECYPLTRLCDDRLQRLPSANDNAIITKRQRKRDKHDSNGYN